MPKGMDPVDALRVKTLIEKSGTPWRFLHFLGNKGSIRIMVVNTKTQKPKVISDEKKWRRLVEGIES